MSEGAQITFTVSGKAMGVIHGSEIYLDPAKYDDTDPAVALASSALRRAESRRRGKGWSFVITCEPEAAEVIRDFCATVGQSYLGGSDDPEARAEGRALFTAEERIRAAIQHGRELAERGM